MSTPEADPLAQLAAEEAADAQAQQAEASPPQADNEEQPAAAEEPEWKQRGFKDEDAMWKSYRELEQKFHERDSEIGELRRFQREITAQMQQQAQPAQQQQAFADGTPIYDAQTIQAAVDDGTISELQASMIWSEQAARIQTMQMEERLAQRFAPLEQVTQRYGAQDALDALNMAVGDDVVARHAELVARLIEEDRAHYGHPQHGSRRLAEAVKSAEFDYQRQNGGAQPRQPNGQFAPADVVVEGGSGAQGPVSTGGTRLDPEDQQLISSLVPQRAVDEAGIPIPWARG